jgi:hypothetical protein
MKLSSATGIAHVRRALFSLTALGELEARLPAPRSNAEPSRSGQSLTWLKNQYQEALEKAHEQNKSVLVN